jgi:hypothetical protein
MHLNHPISPSINIEAGGVCQNLSAYQKVINFQFNMEVKVLPYITAFRPNFQVLSLISHFTLTFYN